MGSFGDLFSDPRWRRNSIVGMLLAFAGVVGLWGIGFFSFDLLRPVLEKTFRAEGLTGAALAGKTTTWIGITSLLQNFGAFIGVNAFTWLTSHTGRRKAFAISFVAAMGMTAYTFWNLTDFCDIFWMIPLMGFAQLALFGGYAIYLPELFPTRLRSTGTSFCYNVGRLVAAAGAAHAGTADQQGVRGLRGADALRGRDDVPGVPDRPGGAAVRAGDEGQAAAGVSESSAWPACLIRRLSLTKSGSACPK